MGEDPATPKRKLSAERKSNISGDGGKLSFTRQDSADNVAVVRAKSHASHLHTPTCSDSGPRVRSPQRQQLDKFVRESLSKGAVLLEAHGPMSLYQLPPVGTDGMSLGQLFTALRDAPKGLMIKEYNLAQPSLEQVFLKFANEQGGGAPL